MNRSSSRRTRRTRRTMAVTATLATGLTGITGLALSSPATASPASASRAAAPSAAPVPAGLVLLRTLTSLLGTHAWYTQTFHGLPVVDGYYVRHLDKAGAVVAVDDGQVAVPAGLSVTPAVTAAAATTAAGSAVSARAAAQAKTAGTRPDKNALSAPTGAGASPRATLSVVGGAAPALVWSVVGSGDDGETRTLVDATTGAVRESTVLSKNADDKRGRATVFEPNPVVKLQDESLKDHSDANSAVPAAAYTDVTLRRLGSTGTLVGAYAQVVKAKGGLAQSADGQFVYKRNDDRFEQANAYYGIDEAQAYIQRLGFIDVNNESQKLLINTYAGDNSFYSPSADTITYGTGGVDDAEDLEVVWHEYGHAIQDAQVPGFGSSEEAGSIGEGFGDYWAVTMSQPTGKGFDDPCVMDWDSTSYTSTVPHCLRRTDTGKTTDDVDGEVHDDGEIWSNALWDINQSVGRLTANRIILESQFRFARNTTFAAAARSTVATATVLYGDAVAKKVTAAFVARKIL